MASATAYVNGNVLTVDEHFSVADAFAVRDGRFVAVGGRDHVLEAAGAEAEVVDLEGATVAPGFIDTHAHTVFRALGNLASPSLVGAASVEEIVERIRVAAERQAAGTWIVTSPIGEPPDYFDLPGSLRERRWPTRTDLDAAAPDHPVYIPTPVYWPHPAIFNGRALAELGITRADIDESGARIERHPVTGEPTGLVHGLTFYTPNRLFGAVSAMARPAASDGERRAAIRAAMEQNVAAGVTTIYEGHANFSTPDLRWLRDADELPLRVVCSEEVPRGLAGQELIGWMAAQSSAQSRDERLRVQGITVSLDGAIQFGAAHMREPYLGPDGNEGNGRWSLSVDGLIELARLALAHDLRLNVLASGDAAIDIAVAALRAVDAQTPLADREWVVQHVHHPHPEHIEQLTAMGLHVQTYASVDYSKGAEVYVDRLPAGMWESVVPLRWWLDAGANVAHGSDGAHFSPLFQIWAALTRVDGRTGESLLSDAKAISREEALRLNTINGAALLQRADQLGSIEPGKLADFAVIDTDILRCSLDELRAARVVRTVIDGVTA